MKTNWEFNNSFDAIVFDCDGTLSQIEGIDQLAEMNGVGGKVKEMTANAMGEGGLTLEIYEERLNIVQPTTAQLLTLGEMYAEKVTPFASTVIQDLQELGKSVYIMSAGLLPSVLQLGEFLGVPRENVFAVDIMLDANSGAYKDFDRKSPLTTSVGKATILKKLSAQHKRIALIGDGMNDAASAHAVDCFIGFGGNFDRQIIREKSDFYISERTLLPVLPLCATPDEVEGISPVESDYKLALKCFDKGVTRQD